MTLNSVAPQIMGEAPDAPGIQTRISILRRIPGAPLLPRFAGSRSRIIRRSITIDGRRTSVSLDNRFWAHLKRIAGARGVTLGELVAAIAADGRAGNLSACLRLLVLEDLESRAFAPGTFAAHAPRFTTAANGAAAARRPAPRRPIFAEAAE